MSFFAVKIQQLYNSECIHKLFMYNGILSLDDLVVPCFPYQSAHETLFMQLTILLIQF